MTWVVLAIAVALIVFVIGAMLLGRRRTAWLREEFGLEYDRTLERHGDQRTAELDLQRRRERRRGLDIRPLAPDARREYARRWTQTQRRFVDAPASALAEADGLVAEVMRDRGYPVDDFEQCAAAVSVDHPRTVEHYRAAHAISIASAAQGADIEELRRAMVHFRALFDDLLHDGTDGAAVYEIHQAEERHA
jgi:C4-dicarboxylate-specific signal transduction histidine kinase